MEKKQQLFQIQGIQQDLSVNNFSPKYAFDLHNLRITIDKESSLLCLTKEQDSQQVRIYGSFNNDINQNIIDYFNDNYLGDIIGCQKINDKIVIFTQINNDGTILDCIWLLYEGNRLIEGNDGFYVRSGDEDSHSLNNNELWANLLFIGNLNFNVNNFIRSIAYKENDESEKVYWVDGINPCRCININKVYGNGIEDTNTTKININNSQFNFHKIISTFDDTIKVTKTLNNGSFSPGVIQYCYTYFNKYENETPIINYSSLNYIATSQGIANDKTVTCSFNIRIDNFNINYSYLRLYALERNSLDGAIKCRLVAEVTLPVPDKNGMQLNTINIIDDGVIGESYDYSKLLFLNNSNIITNTIYEKDNTLFLGNYNIDKSNYLTNSEKDRISNIFNNNLYSNIFKFNSSSRFEITNDELNSYKGLLKHSSDEILTFKKGETYRIGIQFQFNTGELSEVIYLKDLTNTCSNYYYNNNYFLSYITGTRMALTTIINSITDTSLKKKLQNVVRFRLMMVEPTANDWTCFGQGLLTPCIYNPVMRLQNQAEVMSDYLVRPLLPTLDEFQVEQTRVGTETSNLIISTIKNNLDYYGHDVIFNECQNNCYVFNYKTDTPLSEFTDIYDEFNNKIYYYPYEHSLYRDGEMVNNSCAITNRIKIKSGIKSKITNISPNMFGVKIILKSSNDETTKKNVLKDSYIKLFPIVSNYYDTGDKQQLGYLKIEDTFISKEIKETNIKKDYQYKTIKYYDSTISNIDNATDVINYDKSIEPYFDGREQWYQQFDTTLNEILQYIAEKDRFKVAYIAWATLLKNVYNTNKDDTSKAVNIDTILSYSLKEATTIEEIVTVGLDYDNIINDSAIINTIDFSIFNDIFVKDNQYYNLYTPEVNFLDNLDQVSDVSISSIKILQKKNLNYFVNIDLKNIYRNTYLGRILGVTHPWTSNNVLNSFLYTYDYLPAAAFKGWEGSTNGSGPEDNIMWDYNSSEVKKSARAMAAMASYRTFLWNRKFLNSDINSVIDNKDTIEGVTEINTKIISNILELEETNKVNDLKEFTSTIRVIDNSIDKYYFNNKIYNANNDLLYKGTYNLIGRMQPSTNQSDDTFLQYAYSAKNAGEENNYITLGIDLHNNSYISDIRVNSSISRNDVIPIKYKTTAHLLIKDEERNILKYYYNTYQKGICPILKQENDFFILGYNNIYDHDYSAQEDFNFKQSSYNLTEIHRSNINQYGGKWKSHSDYIGTHSTWIPISQLYPINTTLNEIKATQGDTYFQKAFILKSFPYTNKDINQNINVVSFFVESRVNLDGRTDNINRANYLNVNDTNFNLINDVYSQHNNFFTYSSPNSEEINNYPYQILISNTKQSGNLIDTFQHINFNSFVDLNPLYGSVTAINSVNDILLAIQDTAISRINFNSRIQVAANDGTPIEFKNSEKVDGFTILSDCCGTSNYNTIVKTQKGLYFIDTKTKSLINFTGEINDISLSKGMQSWFKQNYDIQNLNCIYDDSNKDLYICNDDRDTSSSCLCYNEDLGNFVGFFDYSNALYLNTIRNYPLIIQANNNIFNIKNQEPTYNKNNYSVSLIGNENFSLDKMFDTVNFRTSYKEKISLKNTSNNKPFNQIQIANDYQNLSNNAQGAKEKFRIWRYPLRGNNGSFNNNRARNNWIKVTLNGNYKDFIQFYDFDVTYYLP